MFKKKYDFHIPDEFTLADGTTTKDPVIGFYEFYREQKAICSKLEFQKSFLEKEISRLKDIEAQFKKANSEIERLYLKRIGDCKTVKQVKHVNAEYVEFILKSLNSELLCRSYLDSILSHQNSLDNSVGEAASVKIKRLNEKNVKRTCTLLDDEDDGAVYARIMMNELKETAGIEADGKKIIDAWRSGMDAWSVFLSMLAEYKVRRDSIF